MKNSRFYSLFLALLLLSQLFLFSCNDSNAKTNPNTTVPATTAPVSEEKPYLPDTYPAIKDQEFNILTRDGETGYWAVMDLTSKGINDEPINDAVFERNNALEQKYGYKLIQTCHTGASADLNSVIEAMIKANTDSYQAIVSNAYYSAGPLSLAGYFVDLKTVETLDLDNADLWNQLYINEMSVNNKLFSAVGELSITYYDMAWVQLFNKQLAEQYNVGNPYEYVNEGTWTLDVMAQMSRLANEDLNGDGKRVSGTDRFGYAYAPFNNYALFYAGGNSVVTKDENDLPIINVFTTRAVETVDKVKEFISDKNATTQNYGGPNVKIFNASQSLFVNSQLMSIRTDHRVCEFDYGVLPTPKIFDDQENYINVVSSSASVFSIPTTNERVEETGFILNALAYQSLETLHPAYFDTIFSIVSRDSESEEALEKILTGAYFDLSFMYSMGGWFATLMNKMATLDLASTYDADKNKTETDIAAVVEAFSD